MLRLAALCALVLLSVPQFSHAKGTITWEEEAQFSVDVGGKLDVSGKIYRPDNSSTLLIYISNHFKSPLLINLQSKQIEKISMKSMKARDEYSYVTTGVPSGQAVTKYAMKDGASTFSYDGKTVAIA